jgi:ATP-binding cassette subfamily C protein CydCD
MVAWVPQEPLLFAGPVANNVALDTEVDRARLDEALRLSGAASWATPEMILADGGLGRSRGERQMLSIARALYADAPYLLLDEPTASLDRQASALLVETLGTLTAKRTLLVVTHREDIAEQMDTTYEIRDGRVVSRRDERPGVRGLSA